MLDAVRRRVFEKSERLEAKKRRFEITLDGTQLSTKLSSARGTPPRSTHRDFASVHEASVELERLVRDRTERDWELVVSVDGTRRRDEVAGRALRAAIAASPADEAPYLVYSDWLTEHGDPMGELIAVGLALDARPDDALRARHDAIVEASGSALLGIVSTVGGVSMKWRRGFVDRVSLGVEAPLARAADEVLAAFFHAPAGALVRDLVLGEMAAGYHAPLRTLAGLDLPPTLRRLAILAADPATSLFGIGQALARMPNLEVLVLHGADVAMPMALAKLRRLELVTRSPSASLIARLPTFPALDTLTIALDRRGDLAGIDRVLGAFGPALKSLELRGMPMLAPIVDALVDTGLGSRLEELALVDGDLSGADVRKLLAFGQLKRLDVSDQPLASDIVEAIRATFGDRVTVDDGVEGPLPRRRLDDDEDEQDDEDDP